jgi:uncharacterized membrane protein YhaH (DUF805 family)
LSHNFNSLESFVLRRAFWIFVLFNILLFIALPAAEQSERPYVRPNLTPAIVVVALGFMLWLCMLVIYLRAFRGTHQRPSVISGTVFFAFFGTELFTAAFALRHF